MSNRVVQGVVGVCVLCGLALSGCGAPQMVPTPNLYVDSETNPFENVPEALQSNTVDVLYATDRRPITGGGEPLRYDHGRSFSLAFGSAIVEFGEDVPWDVLVEASRSRKRSVSLPVSVPQITEKGRFPETPFPLVKTDDVVGVAPDPAYGRLHDEVAESLRNELKRRLSLTPRKEAFVFIHGYNNSFDHAVSVIADIWHFLGREGVPIAYTWPAGKGGLRGYFYDRESGEFTIYHLKDFLHILASCEELEKIHLVAHSRGTDVLVTTLREVHLALRDKFLGPDGERKLGEVVLAAPDLDLEVLSQRIAAEEFSQILDRITLYMSVTDVALGLSTWLFVSNMRVGRIDYSDLSSVPRVLAQRSGIQRNLNLIDANVNTGFIGHSYFYSHPAISSDLILLLRDRKKLGKEHGRPLTHEGGAFWSIHEGYPAAASEENPKN